MLRNVGEDIESKSLYVNLKINIQRYSSIISYARSSTLFLV